MTTISLKDYKVLVFDVFGTLIDWEEGIYRGLLPLLKSVSSKWTRKEALLAFESVQTDLQAQDPEMLYSVLLTKSFEVLEAKLKVDRDDSDVGTLQGDSKLASGDDASSSSSTSPHDDFAKSIANWPLFPDTVEALRVLARHYKLVVLSNVDRKSFISPHALLSESNTENKHLYIPPSSLEEHWLPQRIPGTKSPFSIILTAQDTKAYKPSLKGFHMVLDLINSELGIPKDQVLVVAHSLYHDHGPANELGLSSVFISRQHTSIGHNAMGDNLPHWSLKFDTLGEMADACENES